MGRYVALMRGINVGGKNKLPMKELAEIFDEAGCVDVKTYIQSGNVIFDAPAKVAAKLPAAIAKQIEARHGLKVPVVLREADSLKSVVKSNPFLKKGADEDQLHVLFLADAPSKEQIASLDPKRSPPDEFEVRGAEIFLRLPNGAGETKLTNAYFDSKLKTISTGRNWRTVQKLLELAGG